MSAGLAVLIAATAVLPATAAGVVRRRRGEARHSRQFGDPPESSGLGGGWM